MLAFDTSIRDYGEAKKKMARLSFTEAQLDNISQEYESTKSSIKSRKEARVQFEYYKGKVAKLTKDYEIMEMKNKLIKPAVQDKKIRAEAKLKETERDYRSKNSGCKSDFKNALATKNTRCGPILSAISLNQAEYCQLVLHACEKARKEVGKPLSVGGDLDEFLNSRSITPTNSPRHKTRHRQYYRSKFRSSTTRERPNNQSISGTKALSKNSMTNPNDNPVNRCEDFSDEGEDPVEKGREHKSVNHQRKITREAIDEDLTEAGTNETKLGDLPKLATHALPPPIPPPIEFSTEIPVHPAKSTGEDQGGGTNKDDDQTLPIPPPVPSVVK
mmetsp:Transcript_30565/g.74445  ORF Transcript_30565/g.74445 Transcript_30565/m.74445 type:complete len:330 (-) Transcript_30565:158-1147(-)